MMAMPCHAVSHVHDTMDEPSMACMAGMSMSRFGEEGKAGTGLGCHWAEMGPKKRMCV